MSRQRHCSIATHADHTPRVAAARTIPRVPAVVRHPPPMVRPAGSFFLSFHLQRRFFPSLVTCHQSSDRSPTHSNKHRSMWYAIAVGRFRKGLGNRVTF